MQRLLTAAIATLALAKGYVLLNLLLLPVTLMLTLYIGIIAGGAPNAEFVIAGNIFVDELHQFRQGDFTMSLLALGADLVGMAAVAGAGMIPLRFLDRRLGPGCPPAP